MYLVKDGLSDVPKRWSHASGLAGWLLERFAALRRDATLRLKAKKRMNLVETLSLGGKKQLLLVSCAGERFLVGTGGDSVQTIVRIHAESDGAKRPQPLGRRDLL